jgi:hypothetical protein
LKLAPNPFSQCIRHIIGLPACPDFNQGGQTVAGSQSLLHQTLLVCTEHKYTIVERGEVNDAGDVTTDDQDFIFIVSNELYLHYCCLVHVIESFEVFEAHIAK